MKAHRPTVDLNRRAAKLYSDMVAAADYSGFLGLEECLELSLGVVSPDGRAALEEVQDRLLVFSSPERGGWYVRLPVRRVRVLEHGVRSSS